MGIGVGGNYGEQRGRVNQSMTYDPWTDWTRGAAYDWLTQPGNIPGQWTGGGNLGSLDIPYTDEAARRLQSEWTQNPTEAEMRGVDEFRKSTNLDEMKKAAAGYFQSIAAPQVRNQLSASGGGRSGAGAEAMTQAGTQMAVPLTTLQNQRQAELGQMLASLGTGASARLLAALGASGQLGLGMGQLQNTRDIAGAQINANQSNQLLAVLSNLLRPLQTRGGQTSEGSDWRVSGQAQYGMSGLNQGGGGAAPNMASSVQPLGGMGGMGFAY